MSARQSRAGDREDDVDETTECSIIIFITLNMNPTRTIFSDCQYMDITDFAVVGDERGPETLFIGDGHQRCSTYHQNFWHCSKTYVGLVVSESAEAIGIRLLGHLPCGGFVPCTSGTILT